MIDFNITTKKNYFLCFCSSQKILACLRVKSAKLCTTKKEAKLVYLNINTNNDDANNRRCRLNAMLPQDGQPDPYLKLFSF